jgi:hypothetical protein
MLGLELLNLFFERLNFLSHFNNFRNSLSPASVDAQRLGTVDGSVHATSLICEGYNVLADAGCGLISRLHREVMADVLKLTGPW